MPTRMTNASPTVRATRKLELVATARRLRSVRKEGERIAAISEIATRN
jgi:hypothetical protein